LENRSPAPSSNYNIEEISHVLKSLEVHEL
jgi:hypothetical protein